MKNKARRRASGRLPGSRIRTRPVCRGGAESELNLSDEGVKLCLRRRTRHSLTDRCLRVHFTCAATLIARSGQCRPGSCLFSGSRRKSKTIRPSHAVVGRHRHCKSRVAQPPLNTLQAVLLLLYIMLGRISKTTVTTQAAPSCFSPIQDVCIATVRRRSQRQLGLHKQ